MSVEIRSVARLIEYVERRCKHETYLFRGQREDKPLVPKIGRGRPNWKIPHWERRMFEDFKRRSTPYLEGDPPSTDWHWLAIAQHHGMGTRLLDWSDNPLAALWFAVEKAPLPNRNGELGHGVVWVFRVFEHEVVTDIEAEDPFDGQRTQVFQPPHIARTIVAQGGWFTVHKYIEKQPGFIALEKNKLYKKRLNRLIIPPEAFSNLKEELEKCGVNAVSMFPNMTGLCDYLNSKWLPT